MQTIITLEGTPKIIAAVLKLQPNCHDTVKNGFRALKRSSYNWLQAYPILRKGVLAGTVLGTAALTVRVIENTLGNGR